MAFDSFGAFMAMGGHGPYVWTCYFVFFVLSTVLIFWSLRQRRAALDSLARRSAKTSQAQHSNASADFARVDSSKL